MFGCTEKEAPGSERGGTLVIASSSDADILFPPLVGSITGRQVTELVYDYLTEVSPQLNTIDDKTFQKRLADSWEWSSDSLSLAVHLDPDARWHDGKPVRSDDVEYTFRVYTHPALGSQMSSQLAAIDSVTIGDSTTAVIWFNRRYPLQFYDATSQMQILPKHVFGSVAPDSLREFAAVTRPVGSGRYRFVSWSAGQSLELAADTGNYRGSPGITRIVWRFMQSPVAATRALFAGEADLYEAMRPEDVKEAATSSAVKIVSSPGADYVFMGFNFRDPAVKSRPHRLFESRGLRRALSMAIDRDAVVRNVLDTLARPAIGPTLRSYPLTDTTLRQLPYDPSDAARLLDSLGWRADARTGMRGKNGEPLRFNILVPSSSTNRRRMAVIIQEQLRKVGVAVNLDEMDFGTFQSRLQKRDFDAALWSWHLGTSPASIREIWTQAAAANGGNNFGSYMNPVFDAYVDSAVSTSGFSKTRGYYTRAYQTLIDDAPAIWLYEPKMVLGLQKRIRTGPMRLDSWWYSLADWYIPAAERIARDAIQ